MTSDVRGDTAEDAAVGPLAGVHVLFEMYQQALAFHCVCALSRLGVPDALADGPQPVSHIASRVGADADALRRVVRLLAGQGLFTLDVGADLVGLTSHGAPLSRRHPFPLAATFATLGISDFAHALTETLRTGRPAVEPVVGEGFWSYLARHPERQRVFSEAMGEQAQLLSLPCVPLLDWPEEGVVADVGGGIGTLVSAVLQEEPGLRGVVADQPQIRDRAVEHLRRSGVADRCDVVARDLFEPPPEADIYLLSRVLHDWDEEAVVRILQAVAEPAGPGTLLRVFEDLLPAEGLPTALQSWSDVVMMALYDGARERTLTEYSRLLEAGGWRLEREVQGPPGISVLEARRADGPAVGGAAVR